MNLLNTSSNLFGWAVLLLALGSMWASALYMERRSSRAARILAGLVGTVAGYVVGEIGGIILAVVVALLLQRDFLGDLSAALWLTPVAGVAGAVYGYRLATEVFSRRADTR